MEQPTTLEAARVQELYNTRLFHVCLGTLL